jgi:hypothetical protein
MYGCSAWDSYIIDCFDSTFAFIFNLRRYIEIVDTFIVHDDSGRGLHPSTF